MKIVKLLALVITLAFSATLVSAQDYRIQAGDSLSIEVLEDPSLNRGVAVLPNGQINFPYAGSVQAAGLTVAEVEAALRSGISSNFASPPTAFVAVRPSAPLGVGGGTGRSTRTIDVYFLGEVATPGRAELERGTTLLQALAVSGGVSRFAATKRIQLRRSDKSGAQTVTTINYKALTKGATLSNDIELKDGDVILVPERRLFE